MRPINGSKTPSEQPSTGKGPSPTRIGLVVLGGVLLVGLIAAFILLLTRDDEPVSARGACGLIIDVTGQPGPEWTEQTLDGGWSQLENSACTDRMIYANLITDNSKASPCQEVNRDSYPGDNDNKNAQSDDRKALWLRTMEEQKDSNGEPLTPIWADVQKLRSCGLYGPDQDPQQSPTIEFEGSDILSAIDTSHELLASTPGPSSLFILSDMVNSMPPIKSMPPRESVDQVIQSLDEEGIIPDLAGTDVVVIGAGTNSSMSPKKQKAVEAFWQAYFDAAGTDVKFRQSIS